MTWVRITSMPSLADGFGANATTPWNYFFMYFNSNWAITSLPTWSFATNNIISAWDAFFAGFNSSNWQLTNLPDWSFDTSNIVKKHIKKTKGADIENLPPLLYNIYNKTK